MSQTPKCPKCRVAMDIFENGDLGCPECLQIYTYVNPTNDNKESAKQ